MDEQWFKDYALLALRIDSKQPFHDIYMFTYYYGKQLLAPLLHAPEAQRNAAFRRLLTEQLVPSDLR